MLFKANDARRQHIPRQRHRVANSAAYDAALRLDSFWFTLRRELDHVEHGEGKDQSYMVDEDATAVGPRQYGDAPEEHRANENTAASLVPVGELEGFVARVRPYFSEERVVGFARRLGIHPGIVVGQLHHSDALPQANLRKFLEKVRSLVAPAAVTDGWGVTPQDMT